MRAITPSTKTAIILFNLGGPDSLEAVQPFLFNLFNDPAIISLPNPFRRMLAKLISKKRAPVAQKIYAEMGGKSPILENTITQALLLEASLSGHGQVKVFVSMRYWHPMSDLVAAGVKEYGPDHIILLPLYPQFSTTTTGSSFKDWQRAAKAADLNNTPTSHVCCYPTHPEFVQSYAQLIRSYYDEASKHGAPRILFSAHGLPEKVVKRGDPYQWQVEETTKAILKTLGIEGVDAVNCYQSRVGPMKWIGPATDDEIIRAAKEGSPIVLAPIAFVSEHSETLVELDIEYRHLAEQHGCQHYYRVPTVSAEAHFIAALTDICLRVEQEGETIGPCMGGRYCEAHKLCPCRGKDGFGLGGR